MKKFALFAMLICAGILSYGCEKKPAATGAKSTEATSAAPAGEKTSEATPPAS
jgi:hypothetical protein